MNTVMKILAYLAISILINGLSFFIKSDFIHSFPGSDFLTMLVTIMAINTATSSYIISKLQELSNSKTNKFDFGATYKEIKLALFEQVILVVVSFFVLVVRESKTLQNLMTTNAPNAVWYSFGVDVLLTLIFVIIIGILWDTAKSVFALTNL